MSANDTQEEWRLVVGIPDYEVSSEGRVASWKPYRNNAPRPTSRRLLKPRIDKDGYKMVGLAQGSGRKHKRVCCLVAEAWLGPRPQGAVVRHLDGSKDNDRPANLQWGTPKENSHDKYRHGTMRRGQQINTVKLTEDDVRLVRRSQKGHSELARELGVSPGAIWHIRDGRTWKHVS